MSAKTNEFFVYSQSPRLPKEYRPLKPKHINRPEALINALNEPISSAVWIPFNVREFVRALVSISATTALDRLSHRKRNVPLLFCREPIFGVGLQIIDDIFRKMILPAGGSYLPHEQIAEVMASEYPENLVLGIDIDGSSKVATLTKGDLSRIYVPLDRFKTTSSGLAPNFRKFSVVDYGHGVRFGEYESSIDAILYECDAEFRKRLKRIREKTELTFGACLKRLRKQRGLRQEDFEPEVSAKTIARAEESGDAPKASTAANIAHKLGLSDADEILEY